MVTNLYTVLNGRKQRREYMRLHDLSGFFADDDFGVYMLEHRDSLRQARSSRSNDVRAF